MARVSIFLVTLALIVGMVGCGGSGGGGGGSYTLTINSTAGGVVAVNNVTIPGTEMFTYDVGTVVSLNATPDAGHRFVNWTGNGTVANVTAANTTITMNGDYSITANFVAVYNLTISSTAGGNVTTPEEGTFTYEAGAVVSLVATPDAGYRFVNWTGDVSTIANANITTTTIIMNNHYSITANFTQYIPNIPVAGIPMVAAAGYNTVGLKSNGTVVAAGDNYYGQRDVGGWTDIIQIAVDWRYTVGLKVDGTVVRTGIPGGSVGDWSNITQVAAGGFHTVGLKSDGTVVATGDDSYRQCNVSAWTGIIQVAAGGFHTVGLKSDGTVVATGDNRWGQCNVGNWTGIIQIAASDVLTVGLKSDRTVVAVARNDFGQCNVSGWTDLVQVAASAFHTVGLKSDGNVVAVGDISYGQCNLSDWDLN
jgi:uncharacterized repeat protein (TIGR02543 family)